MNKILSDKIINYVVKPFYKIYLIPDTMISFVSGIFISVSTGIFTCAIPNSLLTIGYKYIISAILMFIASVSLMLWAIYIKPLQELLLKSFTEEIKNDIYGIIRDLNPEKINAKSVIKKVNMCLLLTVASFVVSVALWV